MKIELDQYDLIDLVRNAPCANGLDELELTEVVSGIFDYFEISNRELTIGDLQEYIERAQVITIDLLKYIIKRISIDTAKLKQLHHRALASEVCKLLKADRQDVLVVRVIPQTEKLVLIHEIQD